MKILMVCAPYYPGPTRHIFRIFEIFTALGDTFQDAGSDIFYFLRDKDALPLRKVLKTEQQVLEILKDIDVMFIWNGSLSVKLVNRARSIGIPVCFAELGWFPQRGTFYFDQKGVNFNSSITDWKYQEITPEQEKWTAKAIENYHASQPLLTPPPSPDLKDFVFVPFQMEADSQIVKHSTRFKTMQQLVDYVRAFVKGPILFKTHPKADTGDLTLPEGCFLESKGSTHDYLPRAKYVITINSTVGLEALTYYKPLIVLGDALYEGRGLSAKVTTDEEMRRAVAWAEQGQTSIGVIHAFLFHLFSKQWGSKDLDDKNKILGLLEKLVCNG